MLGTRSQRKRRTRAGATAVEFAVAISVLLMVIFASIEFVRLNMLKHAVEHASYLAARKGMIIGAKAVDVRKEAEDHLAMLGVTNATVNVTPSVIKDSTDIVQVDISMPILGNSWISPIYFSGAIIGRSRMLAERGAAQMSGAIPPSP